MRGQLGHHEAVHQRQQHDDDQECESDCGEVDTGPKARARREGERNAAPIQSATKQRNRPVPSRFMFGKQSSPADAACQHGAPLVDPQDRL
jgi:hypothetical protein